MVGVKSGTIGSGDLGYTRCQLAVGLHPEVLLRHEFTTIITISIIEFQVGHPALDRLQGDAWCEDHLGVHGVIAHGAPFQDPALLRPYIRSGILGRHGRLQLGHHIIDPAPSQILLPGKLLQACVVFEEYTYFGPLGSLRIHFTIKIVPVKVFIAIPKQSIFLIPATREIIIDLITGTGYTEIILLARGEVFEQDVIPISIGRCAQSHGTNIP